MFTITTTTPRASDPVTLQELKDHLRLNTDSEDTILTNLITAATDLFERRTNCPTLPTTYKQHFYELSEPIYLMRGNVTAIASVEYYDTDNTLQTDTTGFYKDTTSTPASVWYDSYPNTYTNRSPKGAVNFTAGWANASAVPPAVKLCIKQLAGHWFKHREAFGDTVQTEVPVTFTSVVNHYRTGVIGGLA